MRPGVFVLFITFLFYTGLGLKAQLTHKVLFLGNSYTGVNNLPQLVHDVALSAGDTLIFDSHNPGGFQLLDHSGNTLSQSKIMSGGWEYVVLQGQSQESILKSAEFGRGASLLKSQIKTHNPCAVIMLYMTWGRKNGNPIYCEDFPVMCSYQSMDSAIRSNYLNLASRMYTEVSPVSVVWNYLRQNHPGIELYQADESHPSAAGSYAAACCFYTAIFKKDPSLITFNFGLSANDASIIRNAVKTQVFNNLISWDYKELPISDFRYKIGPGTNEVIFLSDANGTADTYFWDFGDGANSVTSFPTHSYAADGTYTVELTTTNCDLQGLHTSVTDTVIQFCSHTPTVSTAHPWLCEHDTLRTQVADSYQWLYVGMPIPETNQFLPDYQRYGTIPFSVLATENGCTELSQEFNETPQWSGYYFDVWSSSDPCEGDTVPFAVLHFSGFLSGSEKIFWYKNDSLLPLMANEDTLFINGPGTYECKVIDSNSNCPLDTTSYQIKFDCEIIGIEDNKQEIFWNLFPNPASEVITIQFTSDIIQEQLQIYNAIGRLIKVVEVSTTTKITVDDLPGGLYYVRIKDHKVPAIKFIKL